MPTDERDRILGMLEAGKISAEQAAVLLDAVGSQGDAHGQADRSPGTGKAPKPKPPAQLLRITVDAREGDRDPTKVHVNVPLKLARFASRFLPKEARAELEGQSIDLAELLSSLGDEVPDGPLVDIDASDADGTKTARILIEVV